MDSPASWGSLPASVDPDRVIAHYAGAIRGPTVVCICGIHGNEPAGGVAAENVVRALEMQRPKGFCGQLVAVAGNRAALARNQRCIDRDLNRCWLPQRVAEARAGRLNTGAAEDAEQIELLGVFDALREAADGGLLALDLHTFSSSGIPFSVADDSDRSLHLAEAVRVPAIVNLQHYIRGTIVEFFVNEGLPVVGLEAGTHDGVDSVRLNEAAIRGTLVAAGLIPRRDCVSWPEDQYLLRSARQGAPACVEVVHRHEISPGDAFVMRSGYRNLQRVRAGEHLADDRSGPIRCPQDGWLLMPLYGAGDDGFFIGIERAFHRDS